MILKYLDIIAASDLTGMMSRVDIIIIDTETLRTVGAPWRKTSMN